MKNVKTLISLTVVITSAIALSLAASSKPVTGGDLARALSVAARTAGATEVSRILLEIEQGKNAKSPLTEAGAVALLKSAGFAATTSHPGRPLTQERADVLVREFGASLVTQTSQSGVAAGRGGLPESVEVCFQEANHGQCVNCCKDMGGGASTCAKSCMVINKPSASEPLP